MRTSWFSKTLLGLVTLGTLVFFYVPLFVVARLSFTEKKSVAWPAEGWTLQWWREVW